MATGISSSTLGISTFLTGSCALTLGLISERSISISGISISALGVSTLAFGISTFAGSAFTSSSSFLILGSSISISERSMLGVSALGAWVCVACVLSPTKSSGISKDIGSSISVWTSFVLEGSTFGFSARGITISGISISIFGDSGSVFSILISFIGSISIGLMTGSSTLGASFLSS